MGQARGRARWAVQLALAGMVLFVSGCAAVIIGGAAAGGALGYAYWRGGVSQDFPAGFPETWHATHAALADLGLQARAVKNDGTGEGDVESRTADGDTISIGLAAHPGRLPADGVTTRVSIRVGVWGDRPLSEHLLGQIQWRLANPAAPPQAPPTAPPSTAPPGQTAPPPLATDAPSP